MSVHYPRVFCKLVVSTSIYLSICLFQLSVEYHALLHSDSAIIMSSLILWRGNI